MLADCAACGHWHQANPCPVAWVRTTSGTTDYPEGCGCMAAIPNATCPGCGREVQLVNATTCRDCWYNAQLQGAEDRFRPLSEALERELEMPLVVDQTGGMVMCLALHLPSGAWVWFSEWDWFENGGSSFFGLYRHDEDEGTYPSNDAIPYTPDNARAIAAWAAPLILEFAAAQEV